MQDTLTDNSFNTKHPTYAFRQLLSIKQNYFIMQEIISSHDYDVMKGSVIHKS